VRTPTVASRRLASEVFLTENSVCVFAIAILAALCARRATSTSKRAYVRREGYYRGWTMSKECRIIKAKRLDPGQLTQLQRLRKRLKEHDGYAHKVDFALNPQERRGRLYPKRGASSVQGLKRDVRKALTHDSYTDIDMINAHPCILLDLDISNIEHNAGFDVL
jgi:hypothetical protein